MYSELEQTLIHELDDVAGNLVVPQPPALPSAPPGRSRWQSAAPLLVAAAVVVAVLATVVTMLLDVRAEPRRARAGAEPHSYRGRRPGLSRGARGAGGGFGRSVRRG